METLFEEYNTEPIKEALKIGEFLSRIKKPEKKEKKTRGITNETQSIIKDFVDEINKERDPKHFKPVTGKQIAVKLLTVFKTKQELYEFFSECLDYKKRKGSFGKRFWGGFNVRLDNTDTNSSIEK